MALDPNMGAAVTDLLGKRRRGTKTLMGPPTPGVGEPGSPLAGPPDFLANPTPSPMWKPPPGAYGNVAPPVGSSAVENRAASAAQNQPMRQPNPVQSALDPQRPESELTADQIRERNRRLREQNARGRANTKLPPRLPGT